jgi:hypothetical protein
VRYFSFSEELSEVWSNMNIGFQIIYPLFLSDFNETEFSGQIFKKYSTIKFHENLSCGQVVPCGHMDRHGRANIRFWQFCEHA